MTSILTRDLLLNMLLGLTALVILVLANVNPTQQQQYTPPGNIIVMAAWPEGDNDVDLWVGYNDNKPVGYSHKDGRVWSLLRDDLGNENDDTPQNFESAFTRGMPDGEYIIDIHGFRIVPPVPVTVTVRLASGALIYKGTMTLDRDRQERTVVRFTVRNGHVVPDSTNQVYKKLHGGV